MSAAASIIAVDNCSALEVEVIIESFFIMFCSTLIENLFVIIGHFNLFQSNLTLEFFFSANFRFDLFKTNYVLFDVDRKFVCDNRTFYSFPI